MHLGANACIIGRNVEKTERVAKDIATARPGAKVIGIGSVDVRKLETLQAAAERCVKELGAIDFVMYVYLAAWFVLNANLFAVLGRRVISSLRSSSFPPMLLSPLWILMSWAHIILSRPHFRI